VIARTPGELSSPEARRTANALISRTSTSLSTISECWSSNCLLERAARIITVWILAVTTRPDGRRICFIEGQGPGHEALASTDAAIVTRREQETTNSH
jgi:hypothetical protein